MQKQLLGGRRGSAGGVEGGRRAGRELFVLCFLMFFNFFRIIGAPAYLISHISTFIRSSGVCVMNYGVPNWPNPECWKAVIFTPWFSFWGYTTCLLVPQDLFCCDAGTRVLLCHKICKVLYLSNSQRLVRFPSPLMYLFQAEFSHFLSFLERTCFHISGWSRGAI